MATVLIVEDEPSIRDSYSFMLNKRGFDISTADNAKTALEVVAIKKFDAIILDLLMPTMSGIEFLRTVKPKTSMPETKILILSNTESAKIVNEALELGGTEFMLKVNSTPAGVADKISSMISS